MAAKREHFRSGLEYKIALDLENKGVAYEYENLKIGYQRKPSKYTPDFELPNTDFYIYYRGDIALHFSSDGRMWDFSDEGCQPTASDLNNAYTGFCKAYECVWGEMWEPFE